MSEPSFFSSLQAAFNRTFPTSEVEPPLTPEEEEQHMPEPEMCSALTFPGTMIDPPSYCEEYAVEGEELCEGHLPHEKDYEPDLWGDDDLERF